MMIEMPKSSISTQVRSVVCVVVPVVLIGLVAWKLKGDDDTCASEESTPEAEAPDAGANVEEDPSTSLADARGPVESAAISESSPPKPRIEIKTSPGRGRGLFMVDRQGQKAVAAGQVVALVRPALTLLFEPFCYTHCFGCFADLHEVPGRRCGDCERFAVCQSCDQDYGLYDWHAEGECRRWQTIPQKVRKQKRLDALWLLVRYRAALERDVDFTDVSEAALVDHRSSNGKIGSDGSSSGVGGVNAAVRLEAALRATAAAQDACGGGEGGKEPVQGLEALQGNEVPPELLPLEKLTGFAQLADLQPQIVRTLMLRLRTNAGAIHLSNGNNGSSGTSSASTSSTVQVGCALSSTLSALNHSCEPNATATVQRGWLVVASLKPIQPGEELTICYVDATSPVAKRQEVLREHYNFDCACSRCVRELQKETFGKAAPEGN